MADEGTMLTFDICRTSDDANSEPESVTIRTLEDLLNIIEQNQGRAIIIFGHREDEFGATHRPREHGDNPRIEIYDDFREHRDNEL